MQRVNLSPFTHYLSISSSFSHSLFLFLSHSVSALFQLLQIIGFVNLSNLVHLFYGFVKVICMYVLLNESKYLMPWVRCPFGNVSLKVTSRTRSLTLLDLCRRLQTYRSNSSYIDSYRSNHIIILIIGKGQKIKKSKFESSIVLYVGKEFQQRRHCRVFGLIRCSQHPD